MNEQSLSAFPGGFVVSTQNEDAREEGIFTTAGFVAVDMSVNNTPVEQFDGDVSIDIDIPAGTMNPETGQPVQPGDVIPLYSYDEDTGEWTFERDVTIPSNGSGLAKGHPGNYRVTIDNITHLSYWNLDWFDTDYCETGVTLNFVSETGCFSAVKAEMVDASTGQPLNSWSDKVIYPNNAEKTLLYAPSGTPVIVRVYEYISYYQSGNLLGEQRIEDLCATGTVDVVFQNDQAPVSMRCIVRCGNQQINLSGYPIYARIEGRSSWSNLGTLDNGELNACFDAGERYDFRIYHDGQWYYAGNYAQEIAEYAAQSDVTLDVNSEGILIADNLTSFTIVLDNIDAICDEF